MSPLTDDEHGPGLRLAQSEVGAVSVCACGVITLALQYLSLRLEPDAFRALSQMLLQAQARLDRPAGLPIPRSDVAQAEAETAVFPPPLPRRVH